MKPGCSGWPGKIALAFHLIALYFSFPALAQTQAGSPSRASSRITESINSSKLQALRGNTHPLALPRYDIGPAPASLPASRMILVLQRSAQQEASLRTWLDSVQNTNSPSFRKWMTPEEFGARFGVSDEDLATVEAWLQSQGFSINKVAKSRMAIEFSGTTAQVETAFHTSIHSYLVNGVQHWANASDPQIPSALAPVVAGVAQLNNFEPTSNAIRGPTGKYNSDTGTIQPTYTVGNTSQGYYIFVDPADAAAIYNVPTTLNPNLSGPAYDGSGVNIGIAGDANIDVTQNANYRSTFGLPAKATNVVIDGSDPGENGDTIEAYLDTQVAGGIAPNANVTLYTAANTTYQSGLFLAIQRALEDNQVDILNVSFGACEADFGTTGNQFINDLWEQAAAQGISVTVSSGDSGSAGCDNPNTETQAVNGLAVNAIGSTPFNISVGGTDFDVLYSNFPTSFSNYVDLTNSLPNHRSALKYIPEEPWNDSTLKNVDIASNYTTSPDMNIIAAGGGISSIYSLPNWQSSASSNSGRALPDVSFLAGNGFYGAVWGICTDLEVDGYGNPLADCAAGATGNNFYLTGVGGTSAAAPAFAGMLALVEQKTGTRLGQADYVLYNLAKTAYSSVFHDVTTGDNSVYCTLNSPDCQIINASIYEYYLSGYNAAAGFDPASGLGSVNVGNLVSSWSGTSLATTNSTLQLDGSNTGITITHGQSVSVNASVTSSSGTPTGDVGLVDNLSPATNPNSEGIANFTLASGTASGSTTSLPGGTYQVSAHYSGSNTFAQSDSNTISVTVNPETSSTTLKVAGIYDPSTGKPSSTPYYGFIYLLDAQPYGNSASAANPNGAATGTVTFNSGTTTLGTASLSSQGVAELQTSIIPGGSNSLTASFPGDASFQASTSASVSYSIVPAVTTLNTPTFTPFGPYYGANETLSVTLKVNSAGVAPTGTVTFMNGSDTIGTASMVGTSGTASALATGTATLTVNNLPSGSNNITAVYNGDSNYAGSTSPPVQLQILLNPTTLGFSPTNSTVTVNQPLQFTVTPSPVSGLPLPTGTVQVYYNQTGGSVSSALVNGVASITIPANTLTLGSYSLYVSYGGDKIYSGATTGYDVNVKSSGTVSPTITVTPQSSISTFPVSVTVAITGPNGNPVPTGSVTLSNPNLYASSQALANGSATFLFNGGLAYGPNTLIASYLGDNTYTAGTATAVVTLPAPGTMYFNSPSTTIGVNQDYSVTVSVLTQPPFPPATGSITLSSGSYSSAATQVVSGSAVITIPANSLALGTDTLTATYSGDSNYLGGMNSETITVSSTPPGLALSGSDLTLLPGAITGNTATISITPSGGFTGSVALTAAITASPAGAQYMPTLSFGATNPVAITGTTAATATLTVSTTAPTTASLNIAPRGLYGSTGTFLALILLFGIPARRRRYRRYFAFLGLAIFAYGAFGCGGGSARTTGGGTSGTTPGTYTVTITGTSGALTTNTTLHVIVQ